MNFANSYNFNSMNKELKEDLKEALEEAKRAEVAGEYFRASHYYRLSTGLAQQLQDSDNVKLGKTKMVEMNLKTLKDKGSFKEFSHEYKIPEEKREAHEKFLDQFCEKKM